MHFDPNELHGRAMLTLGLSDLRTNEIISRILRPGDIAVDIGANIGIMASLMARRVGQTGAVYAFEPHPDTRQRLLMNVASWTASALPTAPVTVVPLAVSERAGIAKLVEPTHFSSNSGLAKLGKADCGGGSHFDVSTVNFDDWSDGLDEIRLIKIDVEGHEDAVLKGMKSSLRGRKIDALIFEEMRPIPSPATETLRAYGYRCYMIDRSFWGPLLRRTRETPTPLKGEATNILAMRNGKRTDEMRQLGWSCLK